jgi:transposase
MSQYKLTDFEWRVIEPLLPNEPRGVLRAERYLLGAMLRRTLARFARPLRPTHHLPQLFVRWRNAGVWNRIMDAITAAHDGDIQMIDSTSVRAHEQAATAKKGEPLPRAQPGRALLL